MDGLTPVKQRLNFIDEFNNSEDIFIFIFTTKVGGLGTKLTYANTIIIFDPDWNPSTNMQVHHVQAAAHQLYSRKPLFDALGVQLFAVIHEFIESEVRDFLPSYWGGVVLHDRDMEFFEALGGGNLLKDNFITGSC